MLKRLLTLAAAAVLLAGQTAGADEASLRKAFAAKFPKAEVQSVTKLPFLACTRSSWKARCCTPTRTSTPDHDGIAARRGNLTGQKRSSRRFPSPICRSSTPSRR
jgi:hypothetical protein